MKVHFPNEDIHNLKTVFHYEVFEIDFLPHFLKAAVLCFQLFTIKNFILIFLYYVRGHKVYFDWLVLK